MNEIRPFLLSYARQGPQGFADPTIWDRVILGELLRASDIVKAARLRTLIQQEFQATMREVDLLAMPTNISQAFPIEAAEPGGPAASGSSNLTGPLNLTGMPAVTLPCGFTPDGLPVGLTLAGRHWEDDVVLRAAYAYEQAATGGYKVPPIAS